MKRLGNQPLEVCTKAKRAKVLGLQIMATLLCFAKGPLAADTPPRRKKNTGGLQASRSQYANLAQEVRRFEHRQPSFGPRQTSGAPVHGLGRRGVEGVLRGLEGRLKKHAGDLGLGISGSFVLARLAKVLGTQSQMSVLKTTPTGIHASKQGLPTKNRPSTYQLE